MRSGDAVSLELPCAATQILVQCFPAAAEAVAIMLPSIQDGEGEGHASGLGHARGSVHRLFQAGAGAERCVQRVQEMTRLCL